MSDREIYSHSGSLASLVSDLKNGQRGIDSDSGDWVYKDYAGVIHAARSYKSYSGSVWNYNAIPTGLTGSRGLITDASGNLAVSTVTSTELGYLSGVTSAIQTQLDGKLTPYGLGLAGRIPYFYSSNSLANSLLYCSSRGIRFKQAPSEWGSSYSAMELGVNAIWGYTNIVDGYPLYISNNRYNDGSGDKPYVSGGSLTYALTDRTFRWYINSGLTAGVAFSPTQVMMLGTSGLRISTLAASSVVVNNSSGYLESSSVTPTELSYLSGVSSAIQTQLNGKLSIGGWTASRALMTSPSGNILESAVTSTELSYLSGVTSAIQTQLAAKVNEGVLVANRALTTDASNNAESSSVTSTELGYLSGVTSAVQTQLNGKISGSGTTGLIPYFTSSGTVSAAKCQYSPSKEQFMWYTTASSELMRLVDAHLWLNTKLVCNGMSTGETGYISMSTSTHTIDVGALTQQNIKISSSANTTLYLYKARIGTLIYLTNIGSTQINVSYDGESGGQLKELYPGQTMQLLCVNTYGTGNQSCTWAIWRTEVNASGHLDD